MYQKKDKKNICLHGLANQESKSYEDILKWDQKCVGRQLHIYRERLSHKDSHPQLVEHIHNICNTNIFYFVFTAS